MKRKYSDINKDLTIKSPPFLRCEICNKKVYSYQLCTQPYVYCSLECLEVLLLSQKNDYLDANNMKRTNNFTDLMILDN